MNAYIERMKEVNPRINAVVDNRFSEAIAEAKICDEQLKAGKFDVETLERKKPLFGLPFSVKESCALKGADLFFRTDFLWRLFYIISKIF